MLVYDLQRLVCTDEPDLCEGLEEQDFASPAMARGSMGMAVSTGQCTTDRLNQYGNPHDALSYLF